MEAGRRFYGQERVEKAVQYARDPKVRRAENSYFIEDTEENRKILALPLLNSLTDSIRVNSDGIFHFSRWKSVDRIPPNHRMFRPFQRGRDYSTDPPKKTYHQLVFATIKAGVEKTMRATEHISKSYDFNNPEVGTEASQQLDAIGHLQRRRFKLETIDPDEQTLQQVHREDIEFVSNHMPVNPKNPDKKRLARMLLKGYLDSLGRTNLMVVATRGLSAEIAAYRRMLNAIPQTLDKYDRNFWALSEERQLTRIYCQVMIENLDEMSSDRLFTNPGFYFGPDSKWKAEAEGFFTRLSDNLLSQVKVRPYSIGAQKLVEHLGAINLPDDSIARKVQLKRAEPTILDYLRAGDTQSAQELVGRCQHFIQTILDVHKDYKTAKPSKTSPSS